MLARPFAQDHIHGLPVGQAVKGFPVRIDSVCGILSGIQHRLGDLAVVHTIHAQAKRIEIGGLTVFFGHHRLDTGGGQLGNEAVAVQTGAAPAVFIGIGNIAVIIGNKGGRAIAHENHDGRPAGSIGHRAELLPGLPQSPLNIGAAPQLHIGIYRGTAFGGQAGNGGDIVIVLIIRPAAHTVPAPPDVLPDAAAVLNAGVPAQRQQYMGIIGIQHNAHPVLRVAAEKRTDGIVCRGNHSIQLGVLHGAGNIQHEYGIRRVGAFARNRTVGRQSGQGHQKVILLQSNPGAAEGIRVRKNGLIRPDTAGKLRGHVRVAEEGLPGIHCTLVCRFVQLRGGNCRRAPHGRQHGQYKHSAQQHRQDPLRAAVLTCFHNLTSPYSMSDYPFSVELRLCTHRRRGILQNKLLPVISL